MGKNTWIWREHDHHSTNCKSLVFSKHITPTPSLSFPSRDQLMSWNECAMLVLNIPEIRACFSLYSSKDTAILKFLPIHIFCPFSWRFLTTRHECDQSKFDKLDSDPCLPSQDPADVSIPQPSRPCFASSGSANHLAIAASLRSGPADFAAGIRGFTRRKSGGRLLPCRYAISWILGGSSSKYTGTCHKPKSPKSARWRNFSMVNKYVYLFLYIETYTPQNLHTAICQTYTPQNISPTPSFKSHPSIPLVSRCLESLPSLQGTYLRWRVFKELAQHLPPRRSAISPEKPSKVNSWWNM